MDLPTARVVIELEALRIRHHETFAYLQSEEGAALPLEKVVLVQRQYSIMEQYIEVLEARLHLGL